MLSNNLYLVYLLTKRLEFCRITIQIFYDLVAFIRRIMKAKYSIIVPVYNEEQAIPLFYQAVIPVMEKLDEPFEILFVNDGSRDNTLGVLHQLAENDKRIKVVSFSRNFGQQAAIFAGFENAEGDAVVDIDVDLQDPVEAIPLMIEKWKQGYDIVHGKRTKRKGETFLKKFTSKIYLKFLKKISGLDIPANVGEFKLFDRKVVDTLVNMPEHDRYLRGITSWVGFKQTEVEFVRNERSVGETKYSVKKLFKLAGRSVISMTTWPLSLSMKAGILGGFSSCICFLVFIILACCKIVLPVSAWLFPTITLLFSIMFVFNGLSNIYLRRTYEEVQNRPRYIIAERINIGPSNPDEQNKD